MIIMWIFKITFCSGRIKSTCFLDMLKCNSPYRFKNYYLWSSEVLTCYNLHEMLDVRLLLLFFLCLQCTDFFAVRLLQKACPLYYDPVNLLNVSATQSRILVSISKVCVGKFGNVSLVKKQGWELTELIVGWWCKLRFLFFSDY